jgi:hypothetical protein
MMTATATTNWSLQREIGIDYPQGQSADRELFYPVSAEQAEDGSVLIVDETSLHKNLTELLECRTILVDAAGSIVFDTHELGISDGYGCLTEDGSIGVLRRTTWEVLTFSVSGQCSGQIDLSVHSPYMPRIISTTPQDTFLIALVDSVFEVDILEVDRQGRLLWHNPRAGVFGCPSSVQGLRNGNVLVMDEFCHVAAEVDRTGETVWSFGVKRDPSAALDHLSNPVGATGLDDGGRLLADTRNHRILRVDPEGEVSRVRTVDDELCSPTSARPISGGGLLVADGGNGRVLQLDAAGRTQWQFERPVARRRCFSFPRSVDRNDLGHLLFADTAGNRVLELVGEEFREIAGDADLFWPRCARFVPGGSIVVADSRHSRIVEIELDGTIKKQLCSLDGDHLPLKDPHDVQQLPGGHLLITDASLDLVLEAGWDGRIYQRMGDSDSVRLKDPHSAQRLADGRTLISDTGQHRLVWVAADGQLVQELQALRADQGWLRLHRPRYAEVSATGELLIVDSGNNRVLAATAEGDLLWEISEIPASPIRRLYQPRWATWISADEILISDHSHHRILHLKRCQGGQA